MGEGAPDLSLHRGRRRDAGAAPPRRARRVILESTTYPGTTEELVGSDPGGGLRAPGRRRTSTSATAPSASTRATPTWRLENTPKVVSGVDAASLAAVQGFFDRLVETHRAGLGHPGGRADQAAREHVPPRQHRAGQRAGDVRPRPRHRRLGGHRRRLDQAVRLHAVHARARASAGTACRSTRRTCRGRSSARLGQTFRFVELANDVNEHMPDYVVRRVQALLNDQSQGGQRLARSWSRPRLQGQHRRRPGDARPDPIVEQLQALGADVLARRTPTWPTTSSPPA